MKHLKIKIVFTLLLCLLMGYTLTSAIVLPVIGFQKIYNFIKNPVPAYAMAEINYLPKKEKELSMKEWVLKTVREAGLNEKEADCIITKESNWREDICIIEPNQTISCGLWMLNTIHNKKGLTNACKTDYKCATKFAVEKRIRDGNWGAWTQWKLCK